MKNLIFIALSAFVLVFSSCTKEQVQLPVTESTQVVKNRSNVSVTCTVDSYEIIIDEIVLTMSSPIDLSSYKLVETQTILIEEIATGNTESFTLTVKESNIIIDEIVLTFEAPNINFKNYEVQEEQVLEFEE